MRTIDFVYKLAEDGPKKLISLFMKGEIFLTEKQLDKCINENNKTNKPGRGLTSFKYRKKEEKC